MARERLVGQQEEDGGRGDLQDGDRTLGEGGGRVGSGDAGA